MSMPYSPFVLALLGTATTLAAQCTISWPAAPFGSGGNDTVRASASTAGGALVLAGRFTTVSGTAADRIAQWNGTAWSALGSGLNLDCNALLTLPSGDLIAGGSFTSAGGTPANGVARWNGSAWSALGTGLDPLVPLGPSAQALAVLQNGDLVVGGAFTGAGGVVCNNIARWNGAAWSALGGGTAGPVRALVVLGNGDLVATGTFATAGGVTVNHIARWNGSAWSALGTGLGLFGGAALAVAGNGDLFVGGTFLTAGGGSAVRVARWNGSTWSALGTGANAAVTSLLALPNGELLAGGQFTTIGGVAANRIARWNGTVWSAFGAGADGTVNTLLQRPLGDVIAGGEFANAGGTAAGRIAQLQSSCAPAGSSLGTGCSGSGGLNALAVQRLPLLGSSFRARGTGLPAFGIVLAVTGLTSTSLPLSLVFPQAGPGCTLFANGDLIDAVVPVAGTATTGLDIPNNNTLLGLQLFHQHVPLELDLFGNITAVTASNALQVTIGSF
jgi:hypothetical protein